MSKPHEEEAAAPQAGEVTRYLESLSAGDSGASDRVLEAVYAELRGLADAHLRGERAGHTLQPTALVHEAWMKLVDQSRVQWEGKAHFLGVAALAMRRVLVDHARARKRDKRGGGAEREPLQTDLPDSFHVDLDLLTLDEGLKELERHSERAARVVELRFFAGLSEDETARVLGVARPTVTRDWRAARAWLSDWMARGEA